MRVLVLASLAFLIAPDRGGNAQEHGWASLGSHRPQAAGKCGQIDCLGPGASKCLGNFKTCAERGSCPPGACVSKALAPCCGCQAAGGKRAKGDTACCGGRDTLPVSVGEDGPRPTRATEGKCGNRSCSSEKCTGRRGDCGDRSKSCPTGHCIAPAKSCCCRAAPVAGSK